MIVGRYALFGEIASGGMATVHFGRLAGQGGFSRVVAIKRLHPMMARDPEFVAMMLDEARISSRIRHPNVVPTLDVVSTDGELFIVMEYVHGESLSRLMQTARVPVGVAAAVVAGTLHGLHAAHEARGERGEALGIVHRDVSPHNILVGTDGAPRVVDFGVAKATGRIQATRGDQLKGKLAYLAPEQLDRKTIDRRVDVWAASVVLWELLTGKRLFARESEAESMRAILDEPIEPPGRLDEIVMKGLSRDPAQRYETALDMAVALEESMELPRAHEIGAWVEVAAGDALQAREAQIAEIENRASVVPAAPRKRALWPVALIPLAAAGALVFVLVPRERPKTVSMITPSVPSLAPAPSATPPPPAASSAPTPVASAKRPPPPVVSRPPPSASSSAPKPPVVDCDPPFIVDPSGVKIPKKHCLSR